jgi:S-formylglutathione hydrolase FrmB
MRTGAGLGAALLLLAAPAAIYAAATVFEVTLSPAISQQPKSGRLFLFTQPLAEGEASNPRTASEPRFGPNWFAPEPFFGLDVRDFAPSQSRQMDDSADGFPEKLSKLPPGRYRVQAVLQHNPDAASAGRGEGNFYSAAQDVEINTRATEKVALTLDHIVPPELWPESRWAQEVKLPSDLLGKFHHREVVQKCGVGLPASYYDQPERRYPVIYMVPGFGGSHREALQYANQPPTPDQGEEEFIRVFLTGDCLWGHHVFADSATNGPRGTALVRELIPEIDRRFRTIADRNARFLYGHSSGGWAVLWLMLNYPEAFGGVWSASPDPVDFHDWQGINLYADPPQNMYADDSGNRRPIARAGDRPVLWYDAFTHMDDVLKRGGQLRSFEAVFSPLGADGEPRKMWDRATGQINPDVVRAWQAYDIRLQIERHWQKLQPLWAGRVHILVGDRDTFYLDGAVHPLAEALSRLGSDAEVQFLAGGGHSDILTADFYHGIRRQMSDLFRQEQTAH